LRLEHQKLSAWLQFFECARGDSPKIGQRLQAILVDVGRTLRPSRPNELELSLQLLPELAAPTNRTKWHIRRALCDMDFEIA
jgi:hypothetical protein